MAPSTNTSLDSRGDSQVLPGFGSANFFNPLALDGTVVAALCSWQLRYNFVQNRIPRRATYYRKVSIFLHFKTIKRTMKDKVFIPFIITTLSPLEQITEIICTNPRQSCGNSRYFSCRQIKTKMQVRELEVF